MQPGDDDPVPSGGIPDDLRGGKARFPEQPLRELSMGMSHDYPQAILEGATMVRVGTAIFGKRDKL